MLVVVAIIAMLIAILLPSLRRAQDLARITQCLSQQHQLMLAWAMFPADYSMRIPGSETPGPGVVYPGVSDCWAIHDSWSTYDTDLALTRGSLWPYVGRSKAIYKMPV